MNTQPIGSTLHPVFQQAIKPFLTTTRKGWPVQAALDRIAADLDGLRLNGEQVISILERLHVCLEQSEYATFGSVDLSDIAQTMQEEIEAFDEPTLCAACNGSGEGQYDGTRCYHCKGKGCHPSEREISRGEE